MALVEEAEALRVEWSGRGASPRAQERRHRSGRSLAEGRAPPLPLTNETVSPPLTTSASVSSLQ
jgi:hypothetical protein